VAKSTAAKVGRTSRSRAKDRTLKSIMIMESAFLNPFEALEKR